MDIQYLEHNVSLFLRQANAYFDASAGECVCSDGFVKVADKNHLSFSFKCSPCPTDAAYDSENKTCICNDGRYQPITNSCLI